MRSVLMFLLAAFPALAQGISTARAGTVTHAEGTLLLDGAAVALTADQPYFIGLGKTATAQGGHVEVLMGPGAILWMQAGTRVSFDDTSIANAAITLLEGSVMLELREWSPKRSLTVRSGARTMTPAETGLFRFDAEPRRVRVYRGALLLGDKKLTSGWEADARGARKFSDGPDPSEFHLWAALRSYSIDLASRNYVRWKFAPPVVRHAGFNVTYPSFAANFSGVTVVTASPHLKYLAMREAGLLYSSSDKVWLGEPGIPDSVAQPLFLGSGRLLRTGNGYAEVFLGVGVTACVHVESALRLLDTRPSTPELALETGSVMIELRDNNTGRVRVRVGDSMTELLKQGVYEFHAGQGMLWVHGGESRTNAASASVRAGTRESLPLQPPSPPRKFAAPHDARFFDWCGDQSYSLYMPSGGFMTNWTSESSGYTVHKVFGKRGQPVRWPPDSPNF